MGSMDDNAKLYEQKLSYRRTGAPCQCLAQPWFIRAPHPVYYPRHGCHLEPLICGEKVFRRISEDLNAAQHTVDIITWGFDPGMVLVRGATAEAGMRYGDLLKQIATREKNPVMVRLLIWHDDAMAQKKMNDAPGYYGRLFPAFGSGENGYYSDAHQKYNAEWYEQVCSGAIPKVQLRVREVPHLHMVTALANETLPDGMVAGGTGVLTAMYPAHHQKMILIDYEAAPLAIGYVMGHNSVTDFWDSEEHIYRNPQRERIYRKSEAELLKSIQRDLPSPRDFLAYAYEQSERAKKHHAEMVRDYLDNNSHVAKPYQDVSCRLKGPVLYDLNHNFCQAWQESQRPNSIFLDACRVVPGLRLIVDAGRKAADYIHGETDSGFIKRRAGIRLKAYNLPRGQHSVQLLRTQPQHGEKGVKECYANLTRQMMHYMFIQNQYIQYVTWAEHLIHCVGRLRTAGYLKPMYVFMLTSTPEREGMDSPTYEVASKVGMSEAMKVEHEKAMERARKGKGEQPISPAQLQKQGINVFMGSLWTCADIDGRLRQTDYEEIYIHAKVAVVDDAAFTIGSANLNLRSMAMDSELNVLSEAKDVAFQLRSDLFAQCTGDGGPAQFMDMAETYKQWSKIASSNSGAKASGTRLKSPLLPFYVDRKPGSPVV